VAAGVASNYVWLKPNTTYYVVSFYAELNDQGMTVDLPDRELYYYRQGHTNFSEYTNMLPAQLRDLLP
jgi:hypothetical protein